MEPVRFQVLLLPRMEAAARYLSLPEARAWIETYATLVPSERPRAVIALESPSRERAAPAEGPPGKGGPGSRAR